MSATTRTVDGGRATPRNADDWYSTPAWCVERLLTVEPIAAALRQRYVVDPCAGDGAILAALGPFGCAIRAGMELSAERAVACNRVARCINGDFITSSHRIARPEYATAVVTNPPYSLAREFVETAIALPSCDLVIMLLRVNWLAGVKRASFHRRQPAALYVLSKRPSFTGGGPDATEYAWFAWTNPNAPISGIVPGTWAIL
jgi:predicted RNA methylase